MSWQLDAGRVARRGTNPTLLCFREKWPSQGRRKARECCGIVLSYTKAIAMRKDIGRGDKEWGLKWTLISHEERGEYITLRSRLQRTRGRFESSEKPA